MFVLDTNVVSELRKSGDRRADANVVRWFAEVDADLLYVSVITILELEMGGLRMERRDPAQGNPLRSWMDARVLPEFARRTLPIDTAVALCCAQLNVPDPRPERDGLIAATALVHDMTLVTRNVVDFEPMRVRLIDPWRS